MNQLILESCLHFWDPKQCLQKMIIKCLCPMAYNNLEPCIAISQSRNSSHFRKHSVHHRIHNSTLKVYSLNQVNPLHRFTLHYLKIHFNIILTRLPSTHCPSLFPTKHSALRTEKVINKNTRNFITNSVL